MYELMIFEPVELREDLVAGLRIQIGSGFNRVSGSDSGSRRAKMTHKSRKIFEVLDGLFWELKASSVTWMFLMEA
jgi:hypothetical protein